MCGKAIKSVLGLGSSTPEMKQVDPVATMTNVEDSTDTTGDEDATNKAKKKRGFASTQLRDWRSQNTVLGSGQNSGGKSTLG